MPDALWTVLLIAVVCVAAYTVATWADLGE